MTHLEQIWMNLNIKNPEKLLHYRIRTHLYFLMHSTTAQSPLRFQVTNLRLGLV